MEGPGTIAEMSPTKNHPAFHLIFPCNSEGQDNLVITVLIVKFPVSPNSQV